MKAVIDRFEEDKAVLIFDESGEELLWPRSELPEGSAEGDCLIVSASKDIAGTDKSRMESQEIIDRLTDQDKATEEKAP